MAQRVRKMQHALLTTDQVAERLYVSTRTVRRWVAKGLLRGLHIGGAGGSSRLLVPAADVDALIAQSLPAAPRPVVAP